MVKKKVYLKCYSGSCVVPDGHIWRARKVVASTDRRCPLCGSRDVDELPYAEYMKIFNERKNTVEIKKEEPVEIKEEVVVEEEIKEETPPDVPEKILEGRTPIAREEPVEESIAEDLEEEPVEDKESKLTKKQWTMILISIVLIIVSSALLIWTFVFDKKKKEVEKEPETPFYNTY
jgi:hypothetical protein